MAISRISVASAQAAHVAITTPTKGDLIVVGVHRDGSATNGALLAGYINISATGANTNAMRLAYKYSDGTETDTGTWASATSIACMVYRGVDPNVPFGAFATAGSTVANGGTMSYPAITMLVTDNTSWVAAFGAGRTTTNVGTNAPSGMTTETSKTDIAGFDTNATATSWSAHTAVVTASSTSGYRTVVFELRAARTATFTTDPLVQHVASSSLSDVGGGNSFVCYLPQPALSGNLLVLCFSNPHGATITSVIDDQSNSWTAGPTAIETDSDSRLYYHLNATAGTKYVTVVFNAAVAEFQFTLSEFSGIATSSAVDGTATSSNSQLSSAPVASGSITTTQAGDLIFQYACCVSYTAFTNTPPCEGIVADTNFRLLSATNHSPHASQYSVQAASGAINPALFFAQSAEADVFNSLSIAFKVNGSGTPRPAGMRIIHLQTQRTPDNTDTQQFPCEGNLLCHVTSVPNNTRSWSGTTDSSGNSYTKVALDAFKPQAYYAVNATTSPLLNFKTVANAAALYIRSYDITGADPSAFDVSAGNTGTQTNAGDDIVDAPDITPTTSSGMTLVCIGMGTGPVSPIFAPSGAVTDNSPYTGETDVGNLNFGDGWAHYSYSSAAAQAFSWHVPNTIASGWHAQAIAFKAPSGTLKTEIGLAIASTKTMVGLAKASIKTALGLTP